MADKIKTQTTSQQNHVIMNENFIKKKLKYLINMSLMYRRRWFSKILTELECFRCQDIMEKIKCF